MSDEMLPSEIGPAGSRSGRRYTRKEIAAAKRLGMARWTGPHDNREPSGPIYWATGDWLPNHIHHTFPEMIRHQLADLEIVQAAIDREWDYIQIGRQS